MAGKVGCHSVLACLRGSAKGGRVDSPLPGRGPLDRSNIFLGCSNRGFVAGSHGLMSPSLRRPIDAACCRRTRPARCLCVQARPFGSGAVELAYGKKTLSPSATSAGCV